ncbi:MAG: hypothetical protein EXX96DRAFT_586296 [Benjaminiella poitrasii]|nr:MAG: hypothetical protein EXX96DRAFT_586296 [Benjaminiella poitrasii]
MKNQLSHLVPCHTNRLFNTKEYIVYDNSHIKVKIINEQQAESIVQFCSKFMGAVVILENYWFFLTSFSIFIHDKNVDNCADNSRVGHQQEAVSFIRKRTRAGCDYFELATRFNNVELLTTSGFFGNVDSSTIFAFVGSSVQNMPSSLAQRYDTVSSKYIFVLRTSVPLTKVKRLLNQYMKKHAANKWMFVSKKYKEKGFVPNHPLFFVTESNSQKAASLLLKVFVNKTLYKKEIKEVLSNLQMIQNNSLTASEKLMKRYMVDLNSMVKFLDRTYNLTEIKRDMLFVYERTLAGALKRKNIAVAKRAENEYVSND